MAQAYRKVWQAPPPCKAAGALILLLRPACCPPRMSAGPCALDTASPPWKESSDLVCASCLPSAAGPCAPTSGLSAGTSCARAATGGCSGVGRSLAVQRLVLSRVMAAAAGCASWDGTRSIIALHAPLLWRAGEAGAWAQLSSRASAQLLPPAAMLAVGTASTERSMLRGERAKKRAAGWRAGPRPRAPAEHLRPADTAHAAKY